jgi:hypothetical protein
LPISTTKFNATQDQYLDDEEFDSDEDSALDYEGTAAEEKQVYREEKES